MTERTWFAIKAKAKADDDEDDEAEVLIYDEIGGWGIGAADFDRALKAIGPVNKISMRINSPGGDSFAGIAIYNMLKQHPATVNARVDGIAASAASLIAMAGDQITMPENTFMVVHEPLALTIGPASAHRAMADDLDRVSTSYANTYATRSGQTLEAVKSLMAEDRLMNAAECKERGYCDEMVESVEMRASFALDRLPEKHRGVLASVFRSGDPGADSVADAPPVPGGPAVAESTAPDTPGSLETAPEAPELDTPELTVTPPPEAPAAPPAPEAPPAYGPEDIATTIDLCAVAGVPSAVAQKFIAAKTPPDKVRAALLESRAAAADAGIIITNPEMVPPQGAGPDAGIVANKRRLSLINQCAAKEKVGLVQAAWLVDNNLWPTENRSTKQ